MGLFKKSSDQYSPLDLYFNEPTQINGFPVTSEDEVVTIKPTHNNGLWVISEQNADEADNPGDVPK